MTIEKQDIRILRETACEVKEQTVEADIILPEYYPAVAKILKLSAKAEEETVTVTEGKISAAGCLHVELLYSDDENKLHCHTSKTKYTKVIPCAAAGQNETVLLKQDIASLSYKAVAPKKVDVRANIALCAEIVSLVDQAAVSAAEEGIECLREEKEYCAPTCYAGKNLFFSETVPLTDFTDRQAKVLRTGVSAEITEANTVKNKVMLKGKYKLTAVYVNENDLVKKYEYSAPFTEVTDAFGTGEKDSFYAIVTGADGEMDFVEGADSISSAELGVRLKLALMSFEERKLSFVSDAFSMDAKADCRYDRTDLIDHVGRTAKRVPLSGELPLYDETAAEIVDCYPDNITCTSVSGETGMLLTGSVNVNMLIRCVGDKYIFISRSVSFEEKTEENDGKILCSAAFCEVNARLLPGANARFEGELTFDLIHIGQSEQTVLTDIGECPGEREKLHDRIVVYYADKGESVWEIAKENRVRVENVKQYNGIASDVLDTDRVLVFSDF